MLYELESEKNCLKCHRINVLSFKDKRKFKLLYCFQLLGYKYHQSVQHIVISKLECPSVTGMTDP